MRLLATTILVLTLAAPAVAQDNDLPPIQRTDLTPYVPKKAKKMTVILAMDAARKAAWTEAGDTVTWPEPTGTSVQNCKVTSRWRGRCDYTIFHFEPVPYQPDHYTRCTRQVITLIAKKTHRVRSHKRDLGCETG